MFVEAKGIRMDWSGNESRVSKLCLILDPKKESMYLDALLRKFRRSTKKVLFLNYS